MLRIKIKHSQAYLEVNRQRHAVIRQIPNCMSQRTRESKTLLHCYGSRFSVTAGYCLGVIYTGEIIIAG